MRLELIKTSTGSYKIISNSNHKHPVLVHLAQLLKGANRGSEIHAGIYNVSGGFLDTHIKVYSYISEKSEHMNRKQFYRWRSGKRQIYTSVSKRWNPSDSEKELEEVLGTIS